MSENTQNQELDLEFDLNDLPELKPFVSWPAGSYDVTVESLRGEMVTMGSNDVPCVVFKVKLDAVKEVKPIDAATPEVGTSMSWNLPLDGDTEEALNRNQGRVRALLTPFAQAFGTTNNKEIYTKAAGTQARLITSVWVKKGDKAAGEEDRVYSQVKSVIIS
jgi:hypothetical protein